MELIDDIRKENLKDKLLNIDFKNSDIYLYNDQNINGMIYFWCGNPQDMLQKTTIVSQVDKNYKFNVQSIDIDDLPVFMTEEKEETIEFHAAKYIERLDFKLKELKKNKYFQKKNNDQQYKNKEFDNMQNDAWTEIWRHKTENVPVKNNLKLIFLTFEKTDTQSDPQKISEYDFVRSIYKNYIAEMIMCNGNEQVYQVGTEFYTSGLKKVSPLPVRSENSLNPNSIAPLIQNVVRGNQFDGFYCYFAKGWVVIKLKPNEVNTAYTKAATGNTSSRAHTGSGKSFV